MADALRESASVLVSEAKASIENLSPEQVEQELAFGDAILVDIRDAEERAKNGVIPGAVHVSRGMLEFCADPSTPYRQAGLTPDRPRPPEREVCSGPW